MQYIVKQGDYLAKIAAEHGVRDWSAIWLHPENKELRDRRQNPHVLYPGDRLYVPVHERRTEDAATEQRHRFKVQGKPLKLRLKLKDLSFAPMQDTECALFIDGEKHDLVSDGSGFVELTIPATTSTAKLVVPGAERTIEVPLLVGNLDPVDTVSGQKARLNNLGYFAGTMADDDEPLFKSAVEEFQLEQMGGGAAVDGKCGPKTQAKLKQVHGC
jgi:N-acetylmuramoyl-L-alanine amidase